MLLAVLVTLTGLVHDPSGEPVPGATVVAGEAAAITDDAGRFTLDVPGPVTLTVYYGYGQLEVPADPAQPADITLDPSLYVDDCCYVEWTPLLQQLGPPLARRLYPSEIATARSRTAADVIGASAEVRLGGALRLAGAPAVALAFLDGLEVDTLGATRGSRAELTPALGSNPDEGLVRAGIDLDGAARGELTAITRGPLHGNRIWYALGGDLRAGVDARATGQGFGAISYQPTYQEQGRALVLVTAPGWPGVPSAPATGIATVAARASAPEARRWDDRWADLAWTSKFHGERYQLDTGATAEDLRGVRRGAVRASFAARLGWHTLVLGGELANTDRRASIADEWMMTPKLTVDAALATEGDGALPRLGASYDWTREGRARAFVDVSRRADVGRVIVAGAERELGYQRGVAGLAYLRVAGVDGARGWLLWGANSSPAVRLDASFDRAGHRGARAQVAMPLCRDLHLALAGGLGADRGGDLGLGWRRDQLAIDLEAHAGDGAAARMSLTRSW